jgi:hypothetical protein
MIDPTRRGFKWVVGVALGMVGAGSALAGEPTRLTTEGARASFVQPEAEQDAFEEAAVPARYGAEGTQWILFGGGAAYDLEDSTDLNINAAYSVFLIDNVEWLLELGAWYHAQEGDDAASLNPVMEFRWHFFNNGDTSVFLNAGIGVLFATDEVPDTGTGFDFTPRAGVGLTQRIGEGGTRLIAGLRWHHISNARINGEERNPSRDAPMVYVQFAVPF